MYDRLTSNGNGNKVNMRISTLENLLKATEATGASARVNSLKQVIRRNKTDMAQDAKSSLDLMRIIFQTEIIREIWQILDRHARTTFSPAIENLRRNGHVVDEEVMSDLFANILEAAKSAFVKQEPYPPLQLPASEHKPLPEIHVSRPPPPAPQPMQMMPQQHQISMYPMREERLQIDHSPLNPMDIAKWNPERFGLPTLFISATRVSQHMGQTLQGFFAAFPRIFRYTCDEHDRRILAEEGRLREPDTPRIYLLCLEDAREITANVQELEPYAFCAKEALVLKIRRYAQPYFERLLHRQKQHQMQQWQTYEQTRQ